MNTISDTRSDRVFNYINTFLLLIITVIILYPLIFVVSASISDPDLVNQGKVLLLPRGATLDGYRRIFRYKDIWIGYRNTIFYTVTGTIINLIVTLPAAYALSRKDFYGRSFFTAIFTFTMFFGGGLIPTYLLIKNLNMLNTTWVMILPGAVGMWNVIVSRTYFQNNIPEELREAAEIDGCSNTRLFMTIILPLSTPIIAVMALFYGVGHWNSFFNALIYLSDRKRYPLQLILREILVQNQMSAIMLSTEEEVQLMVKQAQLAAQMKYGIIIVSTLPVLMAYPFIQKYFVHGIMVGAIKG